jgi:hypothetical protein
MKRNIEGCFNILVNKSRKIPEYKRLKNQQRICKYQKKYLFPSDNKIIKKLGLSDQKLELSIYVRYSHQVDYPEIAEYIILFLERYFRE